jgi:hypothetical protein
MRSVEEIIGQFFHDEYERLAPEHGWETQDATRVHWNDLPPNNRALMIRAVRSLLDRDVIAPGLYFTTS